MKKRKILAMLMTATLSVGLLAGCGTDNAKEETQNTEEKTDELGFTMIMLRVDAKTKKPVTVENGLYQTWQKPVYEGKELRFIPYYAWANRGEGEMEVWVNQL